MKKLAKKIIIMKQLFLLVLFGLSVPFAANAQTDNTDEFVKTNPEHRYYKKNLDHSYFQYKYPKRNFRDFYESCQISWGTRDSIPPCMLFYFDTTNYDMDKSSFYAAYLSADENPELYAKYASYGAPYAYNKFEKWTRMKGEEDYYPALWWCEQELQQGRLVSVTIVRNYVESRRDRKDADGILVSKGRDNTLYFKVFYYLRSFEFNPELIKDLSSK